MASILERASLDENTLVRDKSMTANLAKESKKRPALRDLSNNKSSLPSQATKDKGSPKSSIASRISRLKLESTSLTERTIEPHPISTARLGSVKDIDADDHHDQMANAEYANDIYRNLWKHESKYSASPDYMSQQTDINERMRKILVDWLVDVHLKFKLRPETMFLTVHIIDRYLSKEQTTRNKLQLVGVTAMLIASKYEEIYAPEVRDFVYISDKAYDRAQILKMEGTILNALDWQLGGATPWHFLLRFGKAGELDEKTKFTAQYVIERYLQEMKSVRHPPSQIAAAAVGLARRVNGKSAWTAELQKYSQYSEQTLQPVSTELLEVAKRAPHSSLKAVHRKFTSTKFLEVSKLPFA